MISRRHTVAQVVDILETNDFNESVTSAIEENEVDGDVFLSLTDNDLYHMFPNRVGVVRKLLNFAQSCKTFEALKTSDTPQISGVPEILMKDDEVTVASSDTAVVGEEVDLPHFSDAAKSALSNENLTKRNLSLILEETAQYILSRGDMKTKTEYQDFSKAMVTKYSNLDFSTPNTNEKSWAFFSRKLSEKLRNIRWKRKHVAEMLATKQKKVAMFSVLSMDVEWTIERAESVLDEEMEKEKDQRDGTLLEKAFEVTADKRRHDIKSFKERNLSAVLEKYPLLKEIDYIQQDFRRILPHGLSAIKENFLSMIATLKTIYGEKAKDWSEANLLIALSDSVTNKQPRNVPKFLTIYDMVALDLSSRKREAPRLVISINQEEKYQGWVVGDEKAIELKDCEICLFVLDLMACYYAWDVDYPSCYTVLHFFQDYLLKDVHVFYKNTKYKMFENKFVRK